MYTDPLKKPVFNKFHAKDIFFVQNISTFYGTEKHPGAAPRRMKRKRDIFTVKAPLMFFPTDAVDRKFCFIVLFPKWEWSRADFLYLHIGEGLSFANTFEFVLISIKLPG